MTWSPPTGPRRLSDESVLPRDVFGPSGYQPDRTANWTAALPVSGRDLLERWQTWADEHDDVGEREMLLDVQLTNDELALAEQTEWLLDALDSAVEDAPPGLQRIFDSERRAGPPSRSVAPVAVDWPAGELSETLHLIRRACVDSINRMTGQYYAVARKNALVRASAVRELIMPHYRSVMDALDGLAVQDQPIRERRVEARRRFDIQRRAAAVAAVADLERLMATQQQVRDRAFPSGRDFRDPSWQSWMPPDRVREVLCCWQSVPISQTLKYTGEAESFETGPWDRVAVVEDFRRLNGFVWAKVPRDAMPTATAGAQALVLRLMAAVPAGKARFTFIDPLGSGSNAAPFLEMAEWDTNLVDSKAWCGQGEITEKLSELNTHLELVIQKYLKGRFDSIEDYNAAAGEVAEPYRFVVVFDFPAQFDDNAAHLLARLVQNGARCGVYVLAVHNATVPPPHSVSVDAALHGLHPMPFHLNDTPSELTRDAPSPSAASPGRTRGLAFLRPDTPPELRFDRDAPAPSLFTRVVLAVGEHGKGANDIVVSPEEVNRLVVAALRAGARSDMPETRSAVDWSDPDTWWTADSSHGLAVPIGRSGARDAAMFAVDTAILSGALVVGRPGSGKSTLLHSLICGAATWYSPAEVELYLLDFKQGVEFLPYGHYALPHAKCVAVDSEREFGVAVLESIVAELEGRAELFKLTGPGIVDVGMFRQRTGKSMPRILVIIDEFHELLNSPDSLAFRSAQLLEKLIKQGRAFGIHLVLGSQSISSIDSAATGVGALFRLLPIRIVLPSDPADALGALGDQNDAAQYLSRRGEGILNSYGGNTEHNIPFQGTLLTEQQRRAVIQSARARADADGYARRPRVFNGQQVVTLEEQSEQFATRLKAGPRSLLLPIGMPLTLDPELTVELSREGGTNVAFVARDEALVNGWGAVALAALTVQVGRGEGTLHFVDCTAAEASTQTWLGPLLTSGVVSAHRARALPGLLAELRATTGLRVSTDDVIAPPLVIVLWGVHRARDLDPENSGFGFVADEAAVDPSADLEWLIRNGPEVGCHVLIWADTPASLGRRLSAIAIRDCSIRVSGPLNDIDADRFEVPAVGLRRAQLAVANVDADRQWRVRSYAQPSSQWLLGVASAAI